MKQIKTFGLLLIIAFIFSACSTGKKAFNKGDYYDATIKAVRNLRSNPGSTNSIQIVKSSYPMALDYYRQKIDQISESNNPNKYVEIVDIYKSLNELADEISRCPAAIDVVKPVTYFNDQLKKAELLALNEQYSAALNLLENKTIDDARTAYRKLIWVKKNKADYKNIDVFLSNAKDLATLKVVVEHLPELYENYDINSNVFYYRIFDELVRKTNNELIKFYKPETAEELAISPQEIVTIQFLEFNIKALVEREIEKSFTSDSIVVGTFTDNNGVSHNVMSVVNADAVIYEKELYSKGVLSINISNYQTESTIKSRKFSNEYTWENRWASYNGDARAVPKMIISIAKEKQKNPPNPQEMYLLFSEPLLADASSFLKSYFRKKQ